MGECTTGLLDGREPAEYLMEEKAVQGCWVGVSRLTTRQNCWAGENWTGPLDGRVQVQHLLDMGESWAGPLHMREQVGAAGRQGCWTGESRVKT